MTLFPMFSTPVAGGSVDLPLYTDVAMDYDAGTPRWESGQPVVVTGLEAVKSWAWRAIKTARYRFSYNSWDYGCELERLIGQPYRAETRRSEAARYVEEALTVCPYITAATATVEGLEGSTLRISVTMSTVYGKTDLSI